MSRVLLGIGECMVELSQAERGLLRQSFAGDVFNSLYYAAGLLPKDWQASFFTAVGLDPVSDAMLDFIQSTGVDCSTIQRIDDRRPGLYMIHLDRGERSFSYWRETSAARLLAQDPDRLAQGISAANVIYFSGITLAILSPGDADQLLVALAAARKKGALICFDPNIRPALWDSPERMRALIARAASGADVVFPSFDDEQGAFGDTNTHETLDRYSGYGVPHVVLKNGAQDVRVRSADVAQDIPTSQVDAPVDTTGAGDSFNGAFLARYVQDGDLLGAVKAGQDCAARVIQNHGALIQRSEER